MSACGNNDIVVPPIFSSSPLCNISQYMNDESLQKNQGIVRTIFFIVNGSTYKITLVLYTGMTCYELKDGDYWMVRFLVVKNLNALLTVMFASFAV